MKMYKYTFKHDNWMDITIECESYEKAKKIHTKLWKKGKKFDY